MTDAVALAIVAAIPPTLAGVAALIVSIRNGKKSDQIHVLVNSNMTAVKADLATAAKRIASLEALLDALQKPAGDY